MSTAKKRVALTTAEKAAVVHEKGRDASLTREQLIEYCSAKFGKRPSPACITNILKDPKRWEEAASDPYTAKRAKLRPSPVAGLEAALAAWVEQQKAQNFPLTDETLLAKAHAIGQHTSLPDHFNFSHSWLLRFKHRHDMCQRKLHTQAASADMDGVALAREALPRLLEHVSRDDLYNLREAAVYYTQLPTRTRASHQRAGAVTNKQRLTVALCCNASGTDKLPLYVIGKAANPGCFAKGWRSLHDSGAHYDSNSSAWMTSTIFNNFLKDFTRHVQRPVWLIVNNARSHIVADGTPGTWFGLKGVSIGTVNVVFLPPNTTSHVQPLDAGIIRSFKAKYRVRHLTWLSKELEDTSVTAARLHVPLDVAFHWCQNAWKDISVDTIRHCWDHADILPGDDHIDELNALLKPLASDPRFGKETPTADALLSSPMENVTEVPHEPRDLEAMVDHLEGSDGREAGHVGTCDVGDDGDHNSGMGGVGGIDDNDEGDDGEGDVICLDDVPSSSQRPAVPKVNAPPPTLRQAREAATLLRRFITFHPHKLANYRDYLVSLRSALDFIVMPQTQPTLDVFLTDDASVDESAQ
ncbi:hypothetical protein PTSG_12868 [Salpingoeca rosetta]|uniref:HTH CENPB-type domain-containing protein n=1 Tax=Salpingoeca rosetta (strain ATCC 50818 / BSB-021) TaxID=946362 RepID=F2UMA6_SALR5|nr:uncharacterized protein PTSG_12868 [Salpingoeca rosetta]EGD78255.1 hypothetical protein PTSG_12868 [Salpingoeca rosetta]|eukprot:XP_004989578.1 hypothetical protein PTSG_12868 [Salpingoeca rosetta]